MKKITTLVSACVLAAVAGQVGAAGKGQRASVDVQTTCALHGTSFDVNVAVTDKSSGAEQAVVSDYSIEAVYKDRDTRGQATLEFTPPVAQSASGLADLVGSGIVYQASFSLCEDGALRADLANARAINAEVFVTYGPNGKTIGNSCSDDPTTEAIEPGGIKLSVEDLAALDALCAAP